MRTSSSGFIGKAFGQEHVGLRLWHRLVKGFPRFLESASGSSFGAVAARHGGACRLSIERRANARKLCDLGLRISLRPRIIESKMAAILNRGIRGIRGNPRRQAILFRVFRVFRGCSLPALVLATPGEDFGVQRRGLRGFGLRATLLRSFAKMVVGRAKKGW